MFYIFLDDAGLYQGFTEVHARTSCELWQAGAYTHTHTRTWCACFFCWHLVIRHACPDMFVFGLARFVMGCFSWGHFI